MGLQYHISFFRPAEKCSLGWLFMLVSAGLVILYHTTVVDQQNFAFKTKAI